MNLKPVLMLAAAGVSVLAGAAEYFVSNSGDNKNPGSAEKPFKTIQYGIDKAKPGDTVTVRGGIYREQVVIRKSGLPGKPITLRGAKDETALLTAGYPVTTPWVKNKQYANVWENSSPYAVNMLWESKRVARYLEVNDMAWLSNQPGAFILDKKSGKLYVHTFGGESPNELNMIIVPYLVGKNQAGFAGGYTGNMPAHYSQNIQGVYRLNKGIIIYATYITVENLYLNWWPGQSIRVNSKSANCIIRGNHITGSTCGIMCYGPVSFSQVTDNYVRRVAGTGILFTGGGEKMLSARNTIINCGTCPPFKSDISGSEGNIYSMAFYGGKMENLDFIDNTVISTDPIRNNGWRIMRCKGGIRKHTLQKGNVLWGGGVDLYAAPDNSKATICNNTIWGGNGTYGVGSLSSGEKYTPDFKDNLFLRSGTKDPGFADTAYYDFRLLPDSKAIGKGAFPKPGEVLYVNPACNGDGATPMKALPTLAAALKKAAGGNYTVYLAPGRYEGSASFTGKELTVRVSGKGYAVLTGVLDLQGNVKLEDIRFDNCTVSGSGVKFLRSAVCSGKVSAKEIAFEESVLSGSAALRADKLLLKNALIDGNAVKFDAKNIISEHNVFNSQAALARFQKQVKEPHPSFFYPAKLDDFCLLPANSPLVSAGLSAQCIGGRAAREVPREFTVDKLSAVPVAADMLRLEWNTPLDYCNVTVRGYETGSKPQKNTEVITFNQDSLQHTDHLCYMRDLTPGKSYALQFYFYRPGVKKPFRKDLKVTMPAAMPHKPVTLTVGKEGKYKTVGAALLDARKGDTILVSPGTYTERICIGADSLTLKSTVPGAARLNADNLLNCTLNANGTKNFTLDGFFFAGNRYSASVQAMSASRARNLTVRNCIFDRKRPAGCANVHFYASGLNGLLMENCVYDSGFHGVWTLASDNMVFRNNTFWGQGINGIHAGIIKGGKAEIYNNIFMDTVSNHNSPAVTVSFTEGITCDYNLYWKEKTKQLCFGFGCHPNGTWSATWTVMQRDMEPTVKAANRRFGIESHGFEADPLFVNAKAANFNLKPDSPSLKRGKNGQNIGADFSIFRTK